MLGAFVEPDGSLGAALQRRVHAAAGAFKQGIAPTVVATGGKRWRGHVEAHRMRDTLVKLGVPDESIVLETASHNTAENAFFTTRIANQRGWKHIAVVTCPWHLPRAVLNFQRCGMRVTEIPSLSTQTSRRERACLTAKEWTCSHLDAVRLWVRLP